MSILMAFLLTGCHSASAIIQSDSQAPVYLGPGPGDGKPVELIMQYQNIVASSSSSNTTGRVTTTTSSSVNQQVDISVEQFTEQVKEASGGKSIYIRKVEVGSTTFVAGGWVLDSYVRMKGETGK